MQLLKSAGIAGIPVPSPDTSRRCGNRHRMRVGSGPG